MDTIAQVVDDELCTGCGTCAGVCPNGAIKMYISNGVYLPRIEWEKCNRCGICVASCPGYSVDSNRLNLAVFGKQPENMLVGNFLRCYVGHSNDESIRYNSSSGGIATEILIFALEKEIIDGALVVRMRKNKPLEPEPFIARTREEIICASKSKYCPVTLNEALKQILEEEGKFAVVGLPCHIQGIRKAEAFSKKLQKRIVLHIGLMCSHAITFTGIEFLLEKLHIKKEQVAKLDYRGKGWPGSMTVQTKNHKSLSIPLIGGWNAYWPIFSSFFFAPMRCMMCSDQTNEFSDISLGDAWLPELKYEKSGESIVVTRTKMAEDVIARMNAAKLISMRSLSLEKVVFSQSSNLQFKKDDLVSRLQVLKWFGLEIPRFTPELVFSDSSMSYLRALFPCFSILASSNSYIKSILLRVPFPLFRLYYGLYKFLSSV